ncbi:hypothetical protein G7046_g3323 [Stylonectria norvegica]|nr:hypothetical protein G7046_g3323 [Stylonectria norvegica]
MAASPSLNSEYRMLHGHSTEEELDQMITVVMDCFSVMRRHMARMQSPVPVAHLADVVEQAEKVGARATFAIYSHYELKAEARRNRLDRMSGKGSNIVSACSRRIIGAVKDAYGDFIMIMQRRMRLEKIEKGIWKVKDEKYRIMLEDMVSFAPY